MEIIDDLYSNVVCNLGHFLGSDWKESNDVKERYESLYNRFDELLGGNMKFDDEDLILMCCDAYERQGFYRGFKLGARLIMEVLGNE